MQRYREKCPCHDCVHRDSRNKNERLHGAIGIHKRARTVLPLPHVAEEPHETAKRNPIECVFRAAKFADRERSRRIANAKLFHPHSRNFCGNKVPELVNNNEKHENSNDEKCREHISTAVSKNPQW